MGKRKKQKRKRSQANASSSSLSHLRQGGNKPPLSLCMIVKNEAHFLPDCLASVKDLVREIIIVDTGSTDNTIEIARQYSAKIYHIQWRDNFAEARNFALKKATQPWILYLDADERLYPPFHSAVKKAIASNQADAFYVKILSYLNGKLGNVPHTQNYPRIFKKLPGVQFEGRVHEQITPSLKRVGARFANLDVTIEHLGYNLTPEEIETKIARNLRFLEQQVKEEPENWYALYQLGQTLIVDNQIERGLKILHQVLNFDNLTVPIAASALTLIGNQLYLQKQYQKAREYIQKATHIAPRQRLGYFLLSEIEAALENWPQAIEALESYLRYETLAFSDLGVDKILNRKIVVFRLARNWIYLNNYQQAATTFQHHLIEKEQIDQEILENYLKILSHIPGAQAEHFIHHLIAHFPDTQEAEKYYQLVAVFCQEKGLLSLAKQLLDTATQIFPESISLWYIKGNVAAQLNLYKEAVNAFENATILSPTLYEAYYNVAVLHMKHGNFSKAIAWFEKIKDQFPQYQHEAQRRIAALYIKMGKLEEALANLGIVETKQKEALKIERKMSSI